MQTTSDKSQYYTYEEASKLLSISYGHLARCVNLGVFHPVRATKGARKYLLKSEVDAKIGKELYSLRKTKASKQVEYVPVNPLGVGTVNIATVLISIGDILAKRFGPSGEAAKNDIQRIVESEVGRVNSVPSFR